MKKLKIHVQNIWPKPENDKMIGVSMSDTYDAQQFLCSSIWGDQAVAEYVYNEKSSYFSSCLSMSAYNIVGMLDGLRQAEQTGCDVALILCGNDPALQEARDLLSIPVIGITESAMLLACQLGNRFGVITMDSASIPIVEKKLRIYGLEERAVNHRPVRSPNFYEAATNWHTDRDYLYKNIIPRFEDTAKSLIADGAEVIVTACGNYSALSTFGYSMIRETRVPVVEAVSAGAHMALTMGLMYKNFGISTSKECTYRGVSSDQASWGIASASGVL